MVKPNERILMCSWVMFKWEEVKFDSGGVVIVTGCLALLEDI